MNRPSSPYIPPMPKPAEGKLPFRQRIQNALRNGIGFFQPGGYSVGIGRHKIPRLPGTKQTYAYSVRDPAVMREVLVERPFDFPKSRLMYNMLAPLTGNSIFVSNGDVWRKQRAMIDRAFEQARLRDVFPKMRDAADAMVARMDAAVAKGGPVAVDAEATHVAADIIFRTIFSGPIARETADDLFQAFEEFQGLAYAHGMLSLARLPLWLMPGRRRARRLALRVRAALAVLLDKRIAACAAGQAVPQDDILATLIESVDPDTGEPVSREELLNQIAMLFLAGHETSAAALAWSLYLIAQCPAVQDRLQAEAQGVLSDRQPDYSDMRDLPFTRDVFREALRLYPPVAIIARDATQCEHMRNREIAPGSVMFVQTWLLQRNRDIWPDADAFDPERWGCPYAKDAQRQAYLPFSLGPRVCVGAAFAMQEAALVLAMLLRRYRFEPLPGEPEPEPAARLTLRSANGIRLAVFRLPDQNA